MNNPSRNHNNRTISMRGTIDCGIFADSGEVHTWLDESVVIDSQGNVVEGAGQIYQRSVKIKSGYDATVNLKLTATYEQWRDLYHSFAADESLLTLARLEAESMLTLSGRKAERERNMKHLQDYAANDPEGFSWSIYSDFVSAIIESNPLLTHKARGFTDPELTAEVKHNARWLYVLFSYWLKTENQDCWPLSILEFLGRHNIKIRKRTKDGVKWNPKAVTFSCINKIYPRTAGNEEIFYNNFIACKAFDGLNRIKKSLQKTGYYPATHFLNGFLNM